MAEDLTIKKGTKEEQYIALLPQIKGLITGETNQIANLANIAAALKEQFNFFWVGFYLIEGEQLVLAPFQGPVACTRIQYGRGVCGTSWKENRTIIVPNVDEFPGHIACSSLSKSEIVIPVYKGNNIIGILDVDSSELNDFDAVDEQYLTEIVALLS
ncbi:MULTISPECIES: GAF domain-containing protein [unclassified Sphingobacterium]|uniref:GAF domain-containing protein n=1 Tax=Sphingobacterium TaxID=28453 RepID=UPI001043B821|nr:MULTISPECIES: GAF domain-containing protein [unclassified Sphingobacterium]MCS3555434.1 GAF domain-containing protein [Sphingobacterium sp. JUb21]QQD14648.1 GAF domain-containing protein [Sphingobacterium sp. UDSM-2020]TCR02414.1 GAF domain-containing protein [Sphingobacterium sp. JUb20]